LVCVAQTKVYQFVDGHVVVEQPAEATFDLTDEQIEICLRQLAPALDGDDSLEFGIARLGEELSCYLIDVAESEVLDLPVDDLGSSGAVSYGSCEGRVVDLRGLQQERLDAHLLEAAGTMDGDEPLIYLARTASVDLLGLVREGSRCGFVFENASLLAHLPVVLRERGVAACVAGAEEMAAAAVAGRARLSVTRTSVEFDPGVADG